MKASVRFVVMPLALAALLGLLSLFQGCSGTRSQTAAGGHGAATRAAAPPAAAVIFHH
jgi:hypothetical protein